ncbi:MAG: hypothetical protein HC910_03795 [Spirulinaceae cyanobacterium SM2_1_0]|nr:hypothetical protein [Spirulinaceae cyanobacterium SM2_1_0]
MSDLDSSPPTAAIATLESLLSGPAPDRATLQAAIAQLERQRQRGTATDLAGCWLLIWTSGNGRFPARVVQCFTPETGHFENRLETPLGWLSVRSQATYTPQQRLEFVAKQARVELGALRFGLPLGSWAKGWLQTTYLDREWHLERGDRGGLALYHRLSN